MRKSYFALLAILAMVALERPVAASTHAATINGEVTKVDRAAGKVTLRHGPITNLEMDAMTMVFRVADPAMLKTLKAGDRVKFEADRVNGQLTVTSISKSR